MELEQQAEFGELRERALSRLRSGGSAEGDDTSQLLLVLVAPWFGLPVGWEIVRIGGDVGTERFAAICTQWRSDVDLEKFRSPVERLRHPRPLNPTVEACRRELAPEVGRIVAAGLCEPYTPTFARSEDVTLDGIEYELAFSNDGIHTRLKGSNQPIEGKGKLVQFFRCLTCELERRAQGTAQPRDEWESLAQFHDRLISELNATLPLGAN